MGCTSSKLDAGELGGLPALYLDPDDRLIAFDGDSKRQHDPDSEWAFAAANDSSEVSGGDECYLIGSVWLKSWKRFATREDPAAVCCGPIDNAALIEEDDEYALRRTAKFKRDYRAIGKRLWEFFFQAYGGGPALLFFVPAGFSPESYKTGAWMKSANISKIVKVVYPRARKDLCVSIKGDLPSRASAQTMVAEDNAAVAAGLLVSSGALAKVKAVAELQKEADAASAAAVLESLSKPDPKPTDEKEKRPYYAKRLQSAWRRHRSRKRSIELKRKRVELEDVCARLLQSRWRIKQARARVNGMKSQRSVEKEALKLQSILVLQQAWRRAISRGKLRIKERKYGHVLEVFVMEYRSASEPTSSTIQVTLSALQGPHEQKSVSSYHTQPAPAASVVEWNEQAILGGYKGDDTGALLISVIRKTAGVVSIEGQGLLQLKNYPLLQLYQPIDVNLTLKPYAYPIRDNQMHNIYNDVSTNRVTAEEHEKAGSKGVLLTSISLCPFAYSMCGWIYRLSHELLSSKWKKRWFILCDMVLYYYDDPNDVSTLKGTLDLGTVTSISEEEKKGDICYELFGKSVDGEDATWAIRFLDDEPKTVEEMWKRKISRSCRYITGINAFPNDRGTTRPIIRENNSSMLGSFDVKRTPSGQQTELHSVNAVRRMSYAVSSGSNSFQKGGVAKKRASIFGR